MIPRAFLTLLFFGLVACGDDATGLDDIAGTYTLQTVDGEGLPAVLEEVGTIFLLEITAGSTTLNQDMTCSVVSMFRVTDNGVATNETVTDACTYTFDSGAVTLDVEGLDSASGSITGSTLTVTSDEVVFVYLK